MLCFSVCGTNGKCTKGKNSSGTAYRGVFFNVEEHQANFSRLRQYALPSEICVYFIIFIIADASSVMSAFNIFPDLCVTNNFAINMCCNSPLISFSESLA